MERLRSVGETIEEILARQMPTQDQLRKVRMELADLGQDPENALTVWAARQVEKKGMDRVG